MGSKLQVVRSEAVRGKPRIFFVADASLLIHRVEARSEREALRKVARKLNA